MKFFSKKEKLQETNQVNHRIALKGGSYSLTVTVIVLAILIGVNVVVSMLPESITKLDISSAKLYSITSNTKVVVNALEEDVTIYWIVQADMEDDIIENLLAKYDSLSEHISVVKKNPDTYPTFASQYTDETVYNNSLIVECGEKSRYIGYDDLYLTDVDYTTYSQSYSFDGEGAITSAIDYVVSEKLPKVYVLEGHGEAELPGTFLDQIEKENMETASFSLLNADNIPEDADCVLIYAPESDISDKEAQMLKDYVADGGKLLVFAGPVEEGKLENLSAVIGDYGVTMAEGIVVEEDRNYYAFGAPYICLPQIMEHDITKPLTEANYYVIMPLAQGLLMDDTGKGSITELLSTSQTAYSKAAGYGLTTYEREEEDEKGPFSLAVLAEDESGGQIVWVASSYFLDEMYNAYSSGANLDFGMNALSSLIGESEAVAIRSKSLGYNYLTISDTASSLLKTVMIGILPLAFVLAGIKVVTERRKRRNEQI